MLVYATAPNGVALDGSGRNGLFTKHFIKNIRNAGLKIDELFQVVAKEVQEDARGFGVEQVPYRSSSYSGAYCLAGCEDPKLIAELDQIRLQKEEAAKRIKILTEENMNLKRLAEERSLKVPELEARMKILSREAALAGNQTSKARAELAMLQASLATARKEQSDSKELRIAVAERESIINELNEQMSKLQIKADELESYRIQVHSLQRQRDEAAERMQTLFEENARLKRLAEERHKNVATLEKKIKIISQAAEDTGEQSSNTQLELARLHAALAAARIQQRDSESLKDISLARESEIAELKNQIAEFQKKTQQLEESRRQIMALKKENAEKTLLLKEREKVNPRPLRPVIVPSF